MKTMQRHASVHVQAASKKKLRLDIQGLRAVAVGTVLLYHADVPWLQGGFIGVDIFFVISGFLITGGVVKELRRDGTISLRNFYIRRVARIVPAATVTLIATVLATWLLLPETRWVQVGKDAFASTFYFVNWVFAQSSVDYLAQDQAASPLQHFWSLAVEEQFYIIWPALLALVGGLCLKFNFSLQKGLLFSSAFVLVPSLVWSIYYTEANPGGAYFVTTTRMWELAIGAGLAVIVTKMSAPPRLISIVVGWLGLVAIAISAFTYTGALPFPSYTALLPTLGAAAVIWGGQTAGRFGPGMLLASRPLVQLGGVSYSLYLWHWPMLVIVGELLGGITPLTGVLIVVSAIVPAVLSYRLLELRAQEAIKNYAGSQIGIGFMVSIVAAAIAVVLASSVPSSPPSSQVEFVPTPVSGATAAPLVGAEIIANGTQLVVEKSFPVITPNATDAANDLPAIHRNGCMNDRANIEPKLCSFGDLSSSKVITLVGDSHAAMLATGFDKFAKQSGYRLDTYTKGACPFVRLPTEFEGTPYTECVQWVEKVTERILADPPEMVVTAMSRYRVFGDDGRMSFEDSKQPIADELEDSWRFFTDAGIQVSTVRMTPRPDVSVPDCVASNADALEKCALQENEVLWQDGPEIRAAGNMSNVNLIDLSSAFCSAGLCPAVIEGVLVYRDNNHLTATYSRSLQEHISAAMLPLLG